MIQWYHIKTFAREACRVYVYRYRYESYQRQSTLSDTVKIQRVARSRKIAQNFFLQVSNDFCRHPRDDGVGRHVFRYHGTGGHDRILTNRYVG